MWWYVLGDFLTRLGPDGGACSCSLDQILKNNRSVVFENLSPPFDVVTVYVNPSNSSHLPLNAISLGVVVCAW